MISDRSLACGIAFGLSVTDGSLKRRPKFDSQEIEEQQNYSGISQVELLEG
jgi:hypothetical protein